MVTNSARTGRRPGQNDTKEQILAAARAEFAARGFQGATTRSIAEAAGVNVAMIAHYFGGKKQLFAATLELPEAVRQRLTEALVGHPADPADALTRAYLGLWEEAATRGQLLAIVRSALGGGEAMDRLRNMLTGAIHMVAAPDPDREAKLSLAMSHLLGTAIARHVSEVDSLAHMPFSELVERVTPAVRAQLG